MNFQKGARTGLLLFITAGPFLVFLFLYVFGENHFELDTYPLKQDDFCFYKKEVKEALLVVDQSYDPSKHSLKDYDNEMERLNVFWKKINSSPEIVPLIRPSSLDSNSTACPDGLVSPSALIWLTVDTILPIQSAKGPGMKRLPKPPRAFLFDKNQNLRGVYGLCNGLSVDTLMLEYKILTNH
ncbi:MAG TPA: hypothetical protein PK509_06760 [Catalimonadaceae bacterium]|nr:hypothetical protein [Catalimonadaceae bacterium]